ncbi:MAG: hypothetical protein K0S53_2346 [Bacteroidetes bacterium]|nr:hypothetical protein [Bacteroidota bacterium]
MKKICLVVLLFSLVKGSYSQCPTIPVSESSATLTCVNPSAYISVTTTVSPVDYIWVGPNIIGADNTSSIMVGWPGAYSYTLTDISNGCMTTGTISVFSNTLIPSLFLMSNTATLTCMSPTVSLDASSTEQDAYFNWQGPGILSNPSLGSVSVSQPGEYTCTVTNTINGCSNTSIVSVDMDLMVPTGTIIASSYTVCAGSSVVLSSTNSVTAISYHWNTGEITPVITVTPSITQMYDVTFTNNTNGCSSSSQINIAVDNSCQDVWPGDANSDGVADNLDVLELGLHYTQTGPTRASTSNNWQSYFASNWTGTITNGKNLNHSDCNGDGTINNNDTLAIFNNYALTHTFKPAHTTTVSPQLSIVPDQSAVVKGAWGTASIYLGGTTSPISNINGLAFTIDFDNTLIETNNIYLEYQNSFLDAGQNLDFRKPDFSNGKIYTATTHTINGNVSGYGKIATLYYQIKSTLSSSQVLNLGLTQTVKSDAAGSVTPLTSGSGSLTATINVGLLDILDNNVISFSPNPTNGLLIIDSKTELQKIEVVSITGQLLLSEIPTMVSHTLHLDNFSNGIYFVNVYQNDRVLRREKIVLNK